jgi:hypothetical protein
MKVFTKNGETYFLDGVLLPKLHGIPYVPGGSSTWAINPANGLVVGTITSYPFSKNLMKRIPHFERFQSESEAAEAAEAGFAVDPNSLIANYRSAKKRKRSRSGSRKRKRSRSAKKRKRSHSRSRSRSRSPRYRRGSRTPKSRYYHCPPSVYQRRHSPRPPCSPNTHKRRLMGGNDGYLWKSLQNRTNSRFNWW